MTKDADLVQQTFRLPRGLIRRLKFRAVMEDTTQQALVIEAVETLLTTRERNEPKRMRA